MFPFFFSEIKNAAINQQMYVNIYLSGALISGGWVPTATIDRWREFTSTDTGHVINIAMFSKIIQTRLIPTSRYVPVFPHFWCTCFLFFPTDWHKINSVLFAFLYVRLHIFVYVSWSFHRYFLFGECLFTPCVILGYFSLWVCRSWIPLTLGLFRLVCLLILFLILSFNI